MKFTAEQIASILEGEVVGNPNAEVYRLSKIEEGVPKVHSLFYQIQNMPIIYILQKQLCNYC
jgi:UDP-3-O-[3-hydroxymyristoyl] glucosamine N-acyltransferase